MGKELYSTFKSVTVSPLNTRSSSPHQARSFQPILCP